MIEIYNADCIEMMKDIPDNSIDLVLTDPPYGTTKCKWDSIIPLDSMWTQLKRITKPNTPIVLFAGQPFTSALIMSNAKWFKYSWVWDKVTARGHLVAKIRPMQQTEDIVVFGDKKINYYPVMTVREKLRKDVSVEYSRTSIMGGHTSKEQEKITRDKRYPKNIIVSSNASQKNKLHPTQKPVSILEYLLQTYSVEGDMVLDFAAGSFSTGEACFNLNRDCILIEKDKEIFSTGKERLEKLNAEIYKRKD